MTVWRLTRADRVALDGEGGRLYGGRWTPVGYRVVHAASTAALAVLERLVHTSAEHIGDALVLTPIEIPDTLHVTEVLEHTLMRKWRSTPPPEALQQIGLAWLLAGETALLSVPSAIVPHERNMLLNPAHPDFRRVKPGKSQPFTFDQRLVVKERPNDSR
jgi:RES domain-containing protein